MMAPALASMFASALLLVVVPSTTAGSFCSIAADTSWEQVWSDEFEGLVLDEKKWKVEVAPPAWTDSKSHAAGSKHPLGASLGADCHGAGCTSLGSCREAACTRENVYVEDGHLVMRSQRQHELGRNFSTGAVNTWGTASWQAGQGTFRVCISAQLPGTRDGKGAQGLWPAHWMMPHDSTCDPDEGEMDIMEMIDGSGTWEGTYHWQDDFPEKNCSYPTGHHQQHRDVKLPTTWNNTFHEYAVERGLNHVAFVLDGIVQINITKTSQPTPKFSDVPWYLILNTAIGGGWPGPPSNNTVFPAYHLIDYVRVVQQRNLAVPKLSVV